MLDAASPRAVNAPSRGDADGDAAAFQARQARAAARRRGAREIVGSCAAWLFSDTATSFAIAAPARAHLSDFQRANAHRRRIQATIAACPTCMLMAAPRSP